MINEVTYSSFVERYRDKTYIGSGGFAKVYKVYDYANKKYVALKVADVRAELKKFTLKNEVKLVNQLTTHPNVIRYEACYRFNTGIAGEMDFAVLPFYEFGNLLQYLNNRNVPFAEKNQIIRGILEGIRFLHHENCVHRDLKAENILIHKEGNKVIPKIADFGLSRYIKPNDRSVSNSSIGLTFEYASPEQVRNHKIYKNVDLWAAGVLIYKIITGTSPFMPEGGNLKNDVNSQLDISNKIINRILPPSFHSIPQPYKKIIDRCLIVDPKKRAHRAEELIEILDSGATVPTPPYSSVQPSIFPPSPSGASGRFPSIPEEEKTQVYQPDRSSPKPEKEPSQEFTFSPPNSPAPSGYETPRNNVTQFVYPQHNQESVPDESELYTENKPIKKMSAPSEKISKAWIYIPLYVIFVFLSCWLFYSFLTAEKQPPREAVPLDSTPAPAVPEEFLACFETGRMSLGGTFALIPTEEFVTTFEQMNKRCYSKICKTLNAIEAGDNSANIFYQKADKGDECFEPLYNKSLAYHTNQLENLPLLGLFYDSGQYQLSEKQQARLDGFISSYRRSTDKYGLLIIGRASKKGNKSQNKKLSERRGNAIITYIENRGIQEMNMHFAYFGSDPPQLNQDIAEQCGIRITDYRNISFGGGEDTDFSLRLNQSVLLIIYPKSEDPFGLE